MGDVTISVCFGETYAKYSSEKFSIHIQKNVEKFNTSELNLKHNYRYSE